MAQVSYTAHPLKFKRPAGTSRGILHQKPCWYIIITDRDGISGLGEVSFIPGLSLEDPGDLEIRIDHVCKLINSGEMDLNQPLPTLPGLQFALETALNDLDGGGNRILFPSEFTEGMAGITTNGLIWMGNQTYMKQQIREKLENGFRVLKMKVGALDLEEELEVLRMVRSEYGSDDLEIRLDANGAWRPELANVRLHQFAEFGIHSIEQPIAAGQPEAMAEICNNPAIPVALDEELIGITKGEDKKRLLETIQPAYIILKPGLLGGFSAAEDWIIAAREKNIEWWVTSALESDIGLNAIAQWTHQKGVTLPQGLGTGTLFTNNIPSPLHMEGHRLWYRADREWDLKSFQSL